MQIKDKQFQLSLPSQLLHINYNCFSCQTGTKGVLSAGAKRFQWTSRIEVRWIHEMVKGLYSKKQNCDGKKSSGRLKFTISVKWIIELQTLNIWSCFRLTKLINHDKD